jgi:FKBP-type peptidyl-prolyl cis-trans isomerase
MYNKTIFKMKKISVFMVIAAIGMIVASCGNGYNANAKLSSDVDSALYAWGVASGAQLRDGLKTLPGAEDKETFDALIAGFATALNGTASALKMTPEEAQNYFQMYMMTAQTKQFETAKAEGEAFLAANRGKAGVITTESGLQYKVITEGTGKKPALENVVIVHYTGKFLNGTVFESTIGNEPAEFPAGNVIEGWKEALLLMPVGSKYQVWIPSGLAYGEQGWQGIPPNSMLEFEMELLGINE